jgi:hypothetical protein
MRNAYKILVRKPEGKRPRWRHRREYNIKTDLRKIGCEGVNWMYLIGTSGRLLWTRQWTFGFHKRRWISWLAEWLLASLEQFRSMELINGAWKFITVCTRARHRFLSSARCIHSIPPTPYFLKSIPSTPGSSEWCLRFRFSDHKQGAAQKRAIVRTFFRKYTLKVKGVFAQGWTTPWRCRVQKVISFVVYFKIFFIIL